jgi:hypothetical protein
VSRRARFAHTKRSDDAEHDCANEGDGEVGRNDAQFADEGHESLLVHFAERSNASAGDVFRLVWRRLTWNPVPIL